MLLPEVAKPTLASDLREPVLTTQQRSHTVAVRAGTEKDVVGLTPVPRLQIPGRASGLQREESIWNKRSDGIQIVRSCADDQDSDVSACHVLLIPNVLVYCDEDVKVPFSQANSSPFSLPLNPASRTVSHS